jgi:hypothetical protein
MKTLLSILFVSLFSFASQSQVVPKTRTIGGNISAGLRSQDLQGNNQRVFQAGIQPRVGRFLNEKWLLETQLIYGYADIRFENNGFNPSVTTASNHTFGAGIDLTRVFPITEKLYFTTGGSILAASFFNATQTDDFDPIRSQDAIISARISPGLMYFLTPKWILTSQFGALQYQYVTEVGGNVSSYSVGFQFSSFASSIGFRYVLSPRKK